MMRTRIAFCVLLALSGVLPLAAQTPALDFSYRSGNDLNPSNVVPNGSIPVPAVLVGDKSSSTLIIRNRGTNSLTMTSARATGAGFSATPDTATADPDSATLVTINFSPATAGAASGVLALTFAADASHTYSYVFFLSSRGLAPEYVVSYILNPSGNQTALSNNGLIAFGATSIGQTGTATIIITNRGEGQGKLTAAALSGDMYKLSGLPLLPLTLNPAGGEVRFVISFAPLALEPAQGALQLTLGTTAVRINLSGQGTGPSLTYAVVSGSGTVLQALPGATVAAPDANVNSTATFAFTLRNNGNGDARIASVNMTGSAFQMLDVPSLPYTLSPGATLSLTVRFSPKESGPATGLLRIDSAAFTLQAVGFGSKLALTAVVGANRFDVANNGALAFQNAEIGVRSDAWVEIVNNGNGAAVINLITVSGVGFSMPLVPVLPMTIAAGAATSIQLGFTPDSLGSSSGTLQIEDMSVTLRGAANTPPPVPAITFTGLTDRVEPFQQPSVAVRIAAPYTLDLTGTLALSFAPESFVDDPAIQFSSGGRSVAFRIAAGTTDAIFGQGLKQIQFQSGTVAGSITLGVNLATAKVNLTPNPQPAKTMLVDSAVPQLRNLQVANRTANSMDLLVTGISTPRSITDLTFQITPVTGGNVQTTALTANAEAPFRAWYQSDASKPYGSQFTATITLRVTGDLNLLQSIAVTAANLKGASQPMSVNLR